MRSSRVMVKVTCPRSVPATRRRWQPFSRRRMSERTSQRWASCLPCLTACVAIPRWVTSRISGWRWSRVLHPVASSWTTVLRYCSAASMLKSRSWQKLARKACPARLIWSWAANWLNWFSLRPRTRAISRPSRNVTPLRRRSPRKCLSARTMKPCPRWRRF